MFVNKHYETIIVCLKLLTLKIGTNKRNTFLPQPDVVDLRYFKLRILSDQMV